MIEIFVKVLKIIGYIGRVLLAALALVTVPL
jgi:hypothetical protein